MRQSHDCAKYVLRPSGPSGRKLATCHKATCWEGCSFALTQDFRGLLPSQHGPTFYLARNLLANKTDDLTCGYRAGSYSSGDSYHLEIGLLGYICSN
eukprot:5056356-Prymnesium_polylepis.1